MLQDLKEEYLDAPTEISSGSRAQQILSKTQKEKQDYEEAYLTRLPVTKAEKHRQRKLTTLGTYVQEHFYLNCYNKNNLQFKVHWVMKFWAKSVGILYCVAMEAVKSVKLKPARAKRKAVKNANFTKQLLNSCKY